MLGRLIDLAEQNTKAKEKAIAAKKLAKKKR